MTLGKGTFYGTSMRQKINTKSSTEAELVGVNDVMPQPGASGEVKIESCPTKEMVADFFATPLEGALFSKKVAQ